MELVEGESLTDVIRRIGVAGMLDWKYAYRVAVQVGRALAYAHGQKIVHRDVGPANILIEASTKEAKLGDLMLAKALEGAHARQVTRPGELVGDVNYMSPERTTGGTSPVDYRSDLFGLGATCYALLSGKPPFAGASLVETITKIRTAEPLRPSTFQMGIPNAFEAVLLKLLAKNPGDRFQSADELLAELEKGGRANGVNA
jgi:serine/threonine protein kinase